MSNGKCSICGIDLSKGWHADHKLAYRNGGATELYNGQATCPECNLKKGAKFNVELRGWQQLFFDLASKYFHSDKRKSFMLHAGVGSGKTMAATYFVSTLIKGGYNVVICSPGCNVKDSWAREFHKFGIDIDNRYLFNYNYKKEYGGISTTYQSINKNKNLDFLLHDSGGGSIVNEKTILILDEVHHLADNEQSWGLNIKTLGDKCGFVLLLTGTPTRSDNKMIPFATYKTEAEDNRYTLNVDYSYTYADSVRHKICCPISFRAVDFVSGGLNGQLSDDHEDSKSVFSNALTVSKNTFVKSMYDEANATLEKLRKSKQNAAGLIVCNTIDDAKLIGKIIPNCDVITSDENDSNDISAFSESKKKWIVSVRMISEGVNIPRIRVIVYANNITTPLFFQQVAGRGVRNRKDEPLNPIDHCYFYYPNYKPLVNNAIEIENEIKHIVEIEEKQILCFDHEIEKDHTDTNCYIDKFYHVEAGDISHINAGQEIPDVVKNVEPFIDAGMYSELERVFAEGRRSNGVVDKIHNSVNRFEKLKTERIDELRLNINNMVSKIAYKTKGANEKVEDVIPKIHNILNKRIGIKTQNIPDENKLLEKYNLAIQWCHYGI